MKRFTIRRTGYNFVVFDRKLKAIVEHCHNYATAMLVATRLNEGT